MPWPHPAPLTTPRLHLEPLRPEHAREAFAFLDDVRLHAWTGGTPDTLSELEARYARQAKGRSPDGTQGWLNWLLRRRVDGRLVGTVQATLSHVPGGGTEAVLGQAPGGGTEAVLAWVTGAAYQGEGYAREGARAMAEWLRAGGVSALSAYIHPGHAASMAVARALGLVVSGAVVGGEVRWVDHGCRSSESNA
ncbi:GNAT family N-acetyltransferase [Streptomyces sp. NPDC059575]|uniref:GNAT family N-acetyltransferase n=1 Tax=Streptomyces sp. NPDC059575 TaxID=3346872 RepID=UPI0036CB084C